MNISFRIFFQLLMKGADMSPLFQAAASFHLGIAHRLENDYLFSLIQLK